MPARKLAVVDDPLNTTAAASGSTRRRRSPKPAEAPAPPADPVAEGGEEAEVAAVPAASTIAAAAQLEVVSARVPAPLGRKLARAAIELSDGSRGRVRVQEVVAALLARYVVDDGDLVELGELLDDYRGG